MDRKNKRNIKGTTRLIALELATGIISLKLVYALHSQAKINHFELWILSSLE